MVRTTALFPRISAAVRALWKGGRVFSLDSVNPVNLCLRAPAPPQAGIPTQAGTRSLHAPSPFALALAAVLIAAPFPAMARESLGIYSTWGAFRDPALPRCYAIAMAAPSTLRRDYQPFATIGTWPQRQIRNQVHFRLSRKLAEGSRITLSIGGQRFQLTGGGGDAWAVDRRMDAAIVAAMRSASRMTVSARDASGRSFSNSWELAGAASAMDAAAIGCARLR